MPSTFIVRPSAIQRADAHGEVEDLGVGVGRPQPGEESVVDREVVEREPLGVLDREPLPIGVAAERLPVGDVLVVGFGHRPLASPSSCATAGRSRSR